MTSRISRLFCYRHNGVGDSSRSEYEMSKTQGDIQDERECGNKGLDQDDDLENYIKTGDHKSILMRLQSMQLGDASKKHKDRTVFYSLLQNATNGDKILTQKLDECVNFTKEDENDPENAIQIDFTPLMEGCSETQVSIIKDMLDVTDTRARQVLLHPVIRAFLEVKWKKISKVFFVSFLSYCVFLLTYSFYLANIFYRETQKKTVAISEVVVGNDRVIFPQETLISGERYEDVVAKSKPKNHTHLFEQCVSAPSVTCGLEITLLVSALLLFLQEFLQIYALGIKRYVKEYENILELMVLTLALVGLGFQHEMEALKWTSAVGICLAYLEFIFLMGRYPFLGGSISLMFYSIIRRLLLSLSNFLVLIIGFAFGFFIIHHRKASDNFENPGKAIVKTLTMVLGEFDFNDIYDAHEEDVYSRTFTMFLLVGLAIMGSLVLVNLIIALIVTDITELQRKAELQKLVNKAQHVVYIESISYYIFWCSDFFRERIRSTKQLAVCGHNLCHCSFAKMEREVVDALIKIVRRKRIMAAVDTVMQKRPTGASSSKKTESDEDMGTLIMRACMRFVRSRGSRNYKSEVLARSMSNTSNYEDGNVLAELVEILLDLA